MIPLVHLLFPTDRKERKMIKDIAKRTKGKEILEVGSGHKVNRKYIFSYRNLFNKKNSYVTSDINPTFGHKIVDITTFKEIEKYDIILCLSVLEHVFNFEEGIKNMYGALRKEGTLYISVPFFYPQHGVPDDFWRITESGWRMILSDFSEINIKKFGVKYIPYMYFI